MEFLCHCAEWLSKYLIVIFSEFSPQCQLPFDWRNACIWTQVFFLHFKLQTGVLNPLQSFGAYYFLSSNRVPWSKWLTIRCFQYRFQLINNASIQDPYFQASLHLVTVAKKEGPNLVEGKRPHLSRRRRCSKPLPSTRLQLLIFASSFIIIAR